ncbi:hypothetical protein DQ04_00481000 [Trypanosoma grayi]|uniref:hypothetical protein n=1 Tax=Trypanosoma grayi TaxID=71804 RepID=UPI0004F42431|nr:hypothetical protein DQ04_00481000 [Trypanosoma grayi]KEG14405.1 hypothetical protein DQ04_00481000 [Trypanosoma grayi]
MHCTHEIVECLGTAASVHGNSILPHGCPQNAGHFTLQWFPELFPAESSSRMHACIKAVGLSLGNMRVTPLTDGEHLKGHTHLIQVLYPRQTPLLLRLIIAVWHIIVCEEENATRLNRLEFLTQEHVLRDPQHVAQATFTVLRVTHCIVKPFMLL